MSIEVRRATRNDIDHLVEFNAAMARETEGKSLDSPTLTHGVEAVFSDARKGFYFIAERAGEIAGGLLVTTEWSDWRNAYFWWIQSVYVRHEHRGKGVYRTLHRHVERMAIEAGNVCGIRLYVDHDNAAAKTAYERLGMSPARYSFFEKSLHR